MSEDVTPSVRRRTEAMHYAKRLLVSAVSLVAALAFAATAHADLVKCQRAILKESGKFAQAKIKALSKCEEAKVKGKFVPSTNCHTEAKASAAIAKAETKLRAGVDKSCGGPDKECSTIAQN